MHFLAAESDFSDFLLYEVGQDLHSLPVLAINCELAATGILVECDKRATFRLSHYVKLLFHNVDAGGLHGVWVPQVDGIDDELRWNILEQVVAVMMLIHVALHVGSLLEEQVSV